jgi:hypothetical protein
MAPSQSACQRQQQATQSSLERMAVVYGFPVEAAAPCQPAYKPNYQNPDAALEGILGGMASAEAPSTSTIDSVSH